MEYYRRGLRNSGYYVHKQVTPKGAFGLTILAIPIFLCIITIRLMVELFPVICILSIIKGFHSLYHFAKQ